MSMEIAYLAAAEAVYKESFRWYESQRAGLGGEFVEHVESMLDQIAEDPLRYPIVMEDIREAIVSRFPFAIYYRIQSHRVVILSVFHCSRNPSIWQSRN